MDGVNNDGFDQGDRFEGGLVTCKIGNLISVASPSTGSDEVLYDLFPGRDGKIRPIYRGELKRGTRR
jgi:hypothetical protein